MPSAHHGGGRPAREYRAARRVEHWVVCTACGDPLLAERVELGYDYCTRPECQKRRYRGLKVTTVGVHKSADRMLIADEAELAERGETGEFAGRDTRLAMDYRAPADAPGPPAPVPAPRAAPGVPPAGRPRAWTPQQEDVVRLYHSMGLRPAQIVERAQRNNPRLGITSRIVRDVLATRARSGS